MRVGYSLRAIASRSGEEHGFALVLALGVSVVLVIICTSLIDYSTSSLHSAGLSGQRTDSYALAEAGINDAVSIVENVPANDPTNPSLLPSSSSPTVHTLSTGSVSWWGSYDATNRIWTITSTSTARNPTGASSLHTTLTRQVSLVPSLNGIWDRIYNDDTTACLTIPVGTNIPSNLATRGNLCVNGSSITGSTTIVSVGGTTTLTPQTGQDTGAGGTFPGTGAGWTSSGNITANDNVYATATAAGNANTANLTATNFGFAVPTGSTIVGIVAVVRRAAGTSNALKDQTIQLLKAGTAVGSNKATATFWPTGNTTATYPSSGTSDLWGTTWTPADVNDPNFGVVIAAHNSTGSNVTAKVDYLTLTVSYTADASIGYSGSPVQEADLTSTCNWNAQGAHSPCSASDHVWASTVTTSPTNLIKPPTDWSYWYTHAAPGPKHPCDTKTGTPPTFDGDTTYNNSVSKQNIAPSGASYTCIAKDASGNVIGQLSWNNVTQVLTVSGTIFIDGEADFSTHDYVVHYQGRAGIYAPGGSHIDSQVCAGGSGTTSCVTTGMSNWDPSQNVLVMIVGDKMAANNNDCKIDESDSAFQGVYWSKNTCDMAAGAQISGPIIANKLSIASGTEFFPWPTLGTMLPGTTDGAASYTFNLGSQSG